jgi:thiol-disulfide isomerase/thioredoxin
MIDVSRALTRFDQFRVVSRDLTRGTITGGIFTAIAYAVLLMLLMAELLAFMRTTYTTNIVMDQNEDELIGINFDIVMFDLPCKYLKLAVWDKFGEERINSTETFHYIPVDHKGQNVGMAYTKEEITVLEQVDDRTDVTEEERRDLDADWSSSSDHFHHNDFNAAVTFHDFTVVNFFAEWCVHCRKFSPIWMDAAARMGEKVQFTDGNGAQTTVKFLRMNCVDFGETCQKAQIAAFPSVRLYKRDGSFEAFQSKRSVENIQEFLTTSIRNSHTIIAAHHSMFNEGCQVQGTLRVPRVPGHFHLQAEAFGSVNVNPAFSNVSHKIIHLSFGELISPWDQKRDSIPREMLQALSPLDGRTFLAERFHEAPQHYLKVVSTHVQGKSNVYYQMTHTDRTRKLKKDMSQKAPQARFSYDFSPMSVVVKVKSKRWYEFLTSLFAILGGTYTIVELTSGAVDTVSNAVKEAMGKAS